MTHFLVYWTPDEVVDPASSPHLLHSASDQYDRIQVGDVLWMVTSEEPNDLLIESLDDGADEGAQQKWSDEIARRLAELDSGAVKPVPWAEVRRRMTQEAK